MTNFDFKEWADLYQVDPVAFEQRRKEALEGYVDSVDPKHRLGLEQTLFRIRMAQQRSKSPLQSAMESSRLMWESFGKLREQVQKLEKELDPSPLEQNGLRLVQSPSAVNDSNEQALSSADIIQFTASNKRAH